MVLALDYSPDYPTSGTEVTLVATGATGTSREFELTSRPSLSAVPLEKLTNELGEAIDTFTPDEPGEYGIKVYDYRDTGFAPARWTGDVTAQRGKKLIGTATGTVYVGEILELPIATTRGEGATLRLTVVNNTVREASIVQSLTELSRVAALESATVAALNALVGVNVSVLGEDLPTMVSTLVDEYEAHRLAATGLPSIHFAVDDVNAMERVYQSASAYKSITYAIAQLNEVADRIEGHTRSGSSSTRWHGVDDVQYTRMVGRASDIASATVLLVDAGFRVYNRHRLVANTPNVHDEPDTEHAMPSPRPLTTFIMAYLDAIAIVDPTTAAGESDGADDAAHMYGFKRA